MPKFTYPDYGTPDGYPELTAHSGQSCTIIRQLTDEECDPECQPAYRIRFADGLEATANGSELSADAGLEDGAAYLSELGVRVTVTRSGGQDGAVVVFVDTEFEPDGSENGSPGLRILLNDWDAYIGKPYVPKDEDDG